MRLVHLSDLHLGFRQYQRLTPGGINQREADVARSFQTAIDRTIELRPDLVLVGGDVFHNVRPTNPAIVHAFLQFSRLRAALPHAPVVIVAGNHDTPRAAETGSILRLFREIGSHVAYADAERFYFAELGVSVLAVPDVVGKRPAFTPDSQSRYNVLLLHGEVQGMLPAHVASADRAALEIPLSELGAAAFDYVALGHYHVYRQIEPNAYYSGSLDYTSANTWGELYEERVAGVPGKGIIEHDLSTGQHIFHPLAPTREFIDLPVVSARGLTTEEVNESILTTVESCPGGIEDKVVRLVVRDLPRHITRQLDHKQLREFRRRALHFHLDTRRPEMIRSVGHGSPSRRPSLADFVRDKLRERFVSADVDRDALVQLGLKYLREAEDREGGSAAPTAGVEG